MREDKRVLLQVIYDTFEKGHLTIISDELSYGQIEETVGETAA